MTIFTRARRLVASTMHDWFDRLERPEPLARQTVRELDAAVRSAAVAAARALAAERWLVRKRDHCRRQIEQLNELARDAAQTGDEPTALRTLERVFDQTETLARFDAEIAEADAVNRTLRSQLDRLRDRARGVRTRIELHAARHAIAAAAAESPPATPDIDDVLTHLERLGLEAECQAELDRSTDDEIILRESRRATFVRDQWSRLRPNHP